MKELVETDSEGYCTTAVSFDGLWCSRGWSARDRVVAGISLKTGKELDVIYPSSSCSTCDQLEMLHSEGQLSWMKFLCGFKVTSNLRGATLADFFSLIN